MSNVWVRSRPRGGRVAAALPAVRHTSSAIALLLLQACNILDVEQTVLVPADALDDPARSVVLVQGSVADFECAFANYVAASAMIGDELISSAGQVVVTIWDQRGILPDNGFFSSSPCEQYAEVLAAGYGLYTPLQTARFQAENAYRLIAGFDADAVPGKQPGQDSLLATVAAYAGYAYTIFGEGFCSAAFDGGPELQPDSVLRIAEQRFTTALGHAGAAAYTAVMNMASVGRARVRLDLGDLVGAAADARLVDSAFVRYVARAAGLARQENVVYLHNWGRGYVSVDPRFRNLTVSGVADPRVVVSAKGLGNDGLTPLWLQNKYPAASSPIPLASWNEAQLIIAEAEGGQIAVGRINALRTQAGLPLFSSTDDAAIRQQVIEERRRQLFVEGHRLNDMLRLNLPFDSGPYYKGGAYGNTTCLPLPAVERENNDSIP